MSSLYPDILMRPNINLQITQNNIKVENRVMEKNERRIKETETEEEREREIEHKKIF